MLDPKNSRLLYAEQLAPPAGFEFSCAIATSYSVDLEALLAIPLSLYFSDSLDGDLKGEKLALLECICRIKNNLKVFYQAGKIKPPAKFNRLFTLLEPCLQEVVPDGGEFSSFHSKFWLLRYESCNIDDSLKAVHYRLIVLSRNLTFDRSWDICACIDGVVEQGHSNTSQTKQLEQFVEYLLSKAKGFKQAQTLKSEFSQIKWTVPAPFEQLEVLVGQAKSSAPLHFFKKSYHAIAVVSPFLRSADGSAEALQWLSDLSSGERFLFSREEELSRVKPEHLKKWTCFNINPDLVNAEERLELDKPSPEQLPKQQNLHAKLIVTTVGSKTEWHIGSANATSAALGNGKQDDAGKPRNTEIMLRLVGPTRKIGVERLKEQWVSNGVQFFKRFLPSVVEAETIDANIDAAFRRLEHSLTKAKWKQEATIDALAGGYLLTLQIDDFNKLKITSDIEISVELMAVTGVKELKDVMQWHNVPLTSISAFIQIRLELPESGIRKYLIIKSALDMKDGDDRGQAITRELVDTPVKVFNYLHLILLQPDKELWLSMDSVSTAGHGYHALNDMPLLEQLLFAASRQPELLIKVNKTLKSFEEAGVIIPEELKQLWKHFAKDRSHDRSS